MLGFFDEDSKLGTLPIERDFLYFKSSVGDSIAWGGLAGSDGILATYTTTGANSQVFGNVLAGGVSTIGANGKVSGSLVSVGAATTGGAGSAVGGSILSGGVLTTGDGSIIGGNIISSGASTVGANSQIGGNMVSGGAATTGASSKVTGNVQSGGAASTGANSIVVGSVGAVGAISIGGGGTVGSQQTLAASPVAATTLTSDINATAHSAAQQVATAQTALTNMGTGTGLDATITTDRTFYSGVYSAASLSTTAGTTLTFDGQGKDDQYWVFNITDILAIGASTNINLINMGINATVMWNIGGYASIGASATFVGTVLANTYISVGAYTNMLGINGACGGLFSQTSYVSTGDSAKIGGQGCTGSSGNLGFAVDGGASSIVLSQAVVPEPATSALLLGALLLTGIVAVRRI